MKAKAPFMMAAQSSASIPSAIAVERTTSAKNTVANLRSPSTGRTAPRGVPHRLQKRAPSVLS
jgi:hypothetical protein